MGLKMAYGLPHLPFSQPNTEKMLNSSDYQSFLVQDETARDILPRTEAITGGTPTSARSPSAGRSAEIGGRGSEESGPGAKGERENDGEAEKQLESHQET
jgi:hypothetical protein